MPKFERYTLVFADTLKWPPWPAVTLPGKRPHFYDIIMLNLDQRVNNVPESHIYEFMPSFEKFYLIGMKWQSTAVDNTLFSQAIDCCIEEASGNDKIMIEAKVFDLNERNKSGNNIISIADFSLCKFNELLPFDHMKVEKIKPLKFTINGESVSIEVSLDDWKPFIRQSEMRLLRDFYFDTVKIREMEKFLKLKYTNNVREKLKEIQNTMKENSSKTEIDSEISSIVNSWRKKYVKNVKEIYLCYLIETLATNLKSKKITNYRLLYEVSILLIRKVTIENCFTVKNIKNYPVLFENMKSVPQFKVTGPTDSENYYYSNLLYLIYLRLKKIETIFLYFLNKTNYTDYYMSKCGVDDASNIPKVLNFDNTFLAEFSPDEVMQIPIFQRLFYFFYS